MSVCFLLGSGDSVLVGDDRLYHEGPLQDHGDVGLIDHCDVHFMLKQDGRHMSNLIRFGIYINETE